MSSSFTDQIETFELAVYAGDKVKAFAVLSDILPILDHKQTVLSSDGRSISGSRDEQALFTRLAAALVSLFTTADLQIDLQSYELLCAHQEVFKNIFLVSGFVSSDFLVNILVKQAQARSGGEQANIDPRKLLPFTCLGHIPNYLERALAHIPAPILLPWALSLLGTEHIMTEEADKQYEMLLSLCGTLAQGELVSPVCQIFLTRAYLKCSYVNHPEKHALKRSLNHLVGKYFQSRGVTSPAHGERTIRSRPRILVVVEKFTHTHAMYRCYQPSLAQLAEKFELIMLYQYAEDTDAQARALFDSAVKVDFDFNDPRPAIDRIVELAPDMVYYPSIGMSPLAIFLSNLRLAPIQLLSGGHPATTFSPVMDYLLFGEDLFGDESTCSETVLLVRQGPKYTAHPQTESLQPDIRRSPTAIKIAVPANFLKVNYAFLDCCRRIRERTHRPVEFHFFPNCSGFRLSACAMEIRHVLPGCMVHPTSDYPTYLRRLNDCDLCLSTFPFGLTNSLVDAALLGLPTLTLDGPESHSHIDTGLLRRLGLARELSVNSLEDYEARAVELIENDVLRADLSNRILQAEPEKTFFVERLESAGTDFLDLFTWVYRFHEKIQARNKPKWAPEARAL